MTESSDRDKQRQILYDQGWSVVYGDLINEWDLITGIASIPFGATGAWFSEQLQAQLLKFQQSLGDVSDDIVEQARTYLKNLWQRRRVDEANFDGLGVKVGILTYHRRLKAFGGWTKIPNNYQQYMALRITKALPGKGVLSTTGKAVQGFILQTGTGLHETDNTFEFAVGDWNGDGRPDLFAVKKSNTGSKSTEVHILSGASNFQSFILQTGTALHETDDTFEFAVGDWNGDGRPDLFAIKKSNTGSKSTEVHILSGDSNFQSFILQTGTALHETDDTFEFAIGDWNGDGRPDLFAVKKSNTDSKSTEVHILSGASNFQSFSLQTDTALHETDNTFEFAVGDWNGDGRPDLFAVKKSNTGSKSTEVHILSGASNFQSFILQTGTALHETDNTFDFASNTGSKSTEVHIISP
ncbi:unnamed protein product [Penicillium manginii]